MSRRRAALSPSLFPFLAVLVCTLGTLILLLALVAQEAKEAAVAHAEQIKQQAIRDQAVAQPSVPQRTTPPETDGPKVALDDAKRLIEEGQFRVQQLVSFRDAQTQDAETKRNEVAQLEAAIRNLKTRLEALRDEVEMATREISPDEALKLDDATLVMMQEEMEKLRADIQELESNERGQKPRVVIVPHRGPNGTQRRPVYVECTTDEIRIMPEGARITKTQALAAAESNNPNANPLGSALRVARRHAMQAYGDQVAPYPLLIVRPGGIRMFHLASALMKDWDDQYGYELVPGEVDLAFPGGDKVLQKDLEYAIEEASSRNFMFARGSGGGGRGNGGGEGGYDSYGGSPSPTDGNEASGPNSFETSSGRSANAGGSGDFAAQTTMDPGSPQRMQPKKPLPVLSAKNLDQQALKNGFTPARDQRFANAFGTQPPPGSNGQSFGANGAISSNSEALNDFLNGKSSADLDDPAGDPANAGNAGEPGTARSNGTGDSVVNSSLPSGSEGEGDVATEDGRVVGGSQSSPGGNQAMPMPQSMSSSQTANASPSMPSANQSGQPGSPSENESSASEAPTNPSATMTSTQSDNPVRREGRDWAMPEAFRGMGGTEVVRPISMICHHDRYELIDRGRVVATFPFQRGDVYQSTIQLATAIRDRVGTWGATLPGGRWQPRLDVQVGPHAEQRFHELQTLMQGSGVEINRRSP